jgi:hypothetical protein
MRRAITAPSGRRFTIVRPVDRQDVEDQQIDFGGGNARAFQRRTVVKRPENHDAMRKYRLACDQDNITTIASPPSGSSYDLISDVAEATWCGLAVTCSGSARSSAAGAD